MNRYIQQQAKQLNKKHLLRQRWHRWFSVPACIVVFITAYALILPAVTLDTAPDAYCGQEEHIHTDACYETPGISEHLVIACPVQNELHIHTAECYDNDGLLVCGEDASQIIHHHDSFCFDSSGELICTLPEVSAEDAPEGVIHQHTADCLVTIPAAAPEGLICTKAEHIHTSDCLDPEKWKLTPDGGTSAEEIVEAADIEQDTAFMPLTEMTGAELAAMTDEEIAARTEEFLALTDAEFNALNVRMAQSAGDLPLRSNSTPLMAAASDEMMLMGLADEAAALADSTDIQTAAVDLSGTITITDDIFNSGCYVASYSGGTEGVTLKWYRTDSGGTESVVARKYYRVDGKITSNITGNSFEKLNLALDGGGITGSRSSVTYRVVLCVDGVEQEDIQASITNTTHQSEVMNGSFETPVATTGFQPFIQSGADGILWNTSASDGKIELVSVANSEYKSLAEQWHGITSVPDGTQCAEVNAEEAGALYQQVITTPGLTMSWKVSHMARTRSGSNRYNGTDTMYVVIMDAAKAKALAGDTAQILRVAEAIASGQYTVDGVDYSGAYSQLCESVSKWTRSGRNYTNSCTWQEHSGTYTIPAGQYNTTYFFVAASTASNDPTIGNHIDNVWFSNEAAPPAPNDAKLTISKNLYGEMEETALNELRMNMKFNLVRTDDGTVLRTIYAYELGEWSQTGDKHWELSKTISISELVGESIRVEETGYEMDGYEVQAEAATDTEFIVETQREYSVSFKNTYTVPDCVLTVTKYVSAADRSGIFNITVSYPDSSGQTVTQTLPLEHGASGKIAHIPRNAAVTVSEPTHDGYNVRITDSAGTVLSDSDYYSFTITEDTEIHVYNTAGVALPETGGVTPNLFIYGGIALMLFAVVTGYILRRRWGKEGTG